MTAFWILSALLAAAALAIVLRPFLLSRLSGNARSGPSRAELNRSVYRDQLRELEADVRAGTLAQADYERSRGEIERRVLDDVGREAAPLATGAGGRRAAFAVTAAIPLLALGVYFAVGNPDGLSPRSREAQVGMPEIEAMVERLAERLAQNPDDLEGWKMLGKSYSVIGKFGEASKAYAQAARRAPRDPQILADLADAIAMARGQSMKGEPEELVLRALQIDPKNLKALALAGTAAYDRQDFAAAADFWQRMLPLVPAGSEEATTISANVQEARALSRQKPAAAKGGLKGTVTLSPELAAKASPEDTLFIFARAAEGPPMPLAVQRRKAGDLPVAFVLDDSMAMGPGHKLSTVPRVVVGARISRSGNATPQAGDLQGLSGVVANTAEGVRLVIDTEVKKK
jgi:cytochrome c-type biogenesis protein CcmH